MKKRIFAAFVLLLIVFALSTPLAEYTEWKIKDISGFVVVFDPSGGIYEITGISVSRLPQKEQEDLAMGVKVKDILELEKILEGLSQ